MRNNRIIEPARPMGDLQGNRPMRERPIRASRREHHGGLQEKTYQREHCVDKQDKDQ
jgi:hypothetical protein